MRRPPTCVPRPSTPRAPTTAKVSHWSVKLSHWSVKISSYQTVVNKSHLLLSVNLLPWLVRLLRLSRFTDLQILNDNQILEYM